MGCLLLIFHTFLLLFSLSRISPAKPASIYLTVPPDFLQTCTLDLSLSHPCYASTSLNPSDRFLIHFSFSLIHPLSQQISPCPIPPCFATTSLISCLCLSLPSSASSRLILLDPFACRLTQARGRQKPALRLVYILSGDHNNQK